VILNEWTDLSTPRHRNLGCQISRSPLNYITGRSCAAPAILLKADFLIECAVKAVLMEFSDAYHAQDLATLLSFYAPDDDVVVVGSTKDEKCVGLTEIKEAYERDFGLSNPVLLEFTWMSVSNMGPICWVSAECLAHASIEQEAISLPARLTAVLENRGNKWLILQQHFSFPTTS
jgi:ketosteroid isomerase-like protein